jgi:carbamate kinase
MDRAGAFGEGSMAPKVRAAIDFARRTGGRAVITVLDRGQAAVRGEAGTTITAETS